MFQSTSESIKIQESHHHGKDVDAIDRSTCLLCSTGSTCAVLVNSDDAGGGRLLRLRALSAVIFSPSVAEFVSYMLDGLKLR